MNSRLEQAMNSIESRVEEQAVCTGLLTALADIDTRITGSYGRLKAMKVGAIELTGHGELMALRSEGRRLSGRLAATLAVDVQHDVWSGSGPQSYASIDGWQSGSDGYVRQG
jgi:hypothetical protein